MNLQRKLIMGIGHRIKSVQNPDKRVEILVEFARKNFPFPSPMLDYALAVEKITTQKKNNLILNVDGCLAVTMIDFLRNSGLFTEDESCMYIEIGLLGALFLCARTIGSCAHYVDQRRYKQGLWRVPHDDITYIKPDSFTGLVITE